MFSLRRRPLCFMVRDAPVTRPGGCGGSAAPGPTRWAPRSVGRPGHRPGCAGKGRVRTRRFRVTARCALSLARRGRTRRFGRHQLHTGRRSRERTAPTPEIADRASPSRNGSNAHRKRWRVWRVLQCGLCPSLSSPAGCLCPTGGLSAAGGLSARGGTCSPARRAPSRKPFQPPAGAGPIRDRASSRPGGAPEFRTE